MVFLPGRAASAAPTNWKKLTDVVSHARTCPAAAPRVARPIRSPVVCASSIQSAQPSTTFVPHSFSIKLFTTSTVFFGSRPNELPSR